MLDYKPEELKKLKEVSVEILKEFIRICDKYKLDWFVHWGTAIGTVRHQGFIPWDDDIDVCMLREDYDTFLEVAPAEIGDRFVLTSAFLQKDCYGMFTRMSAAGTYHVTEQEDLWKTKHGIRIDIFPFDSVSGDAGKRRKQIQAVRFWNQLYTLKNLPHPYLKGDSLTVRIQKILCPILHTCLKPVPVDWILHQAEKNALKYKGQTRLYTLLYDIDAEKWLLSQEDIYPLQEGTFEGLKVNVLHHNHEALTTAYGNYMELPPESERVNHNWGRLKFHEEND
ncbi:MAG: LicD family protein [Eubacteriales bacterium]|nr:LicD family protein [Eubacteriales bacterium]